MALDQKATSATWGGGMASLAPLGSALASGVVRSLVTVYYYNSFLILGVK